MVHKTADTELSKQDKDIESIADQNLFSGKCVIARRQYNQMLSACRENGYLFKARILRKIGTTYNRQWRFREAVSLYEESEANLQKTEENAERWNEWIELQIEYHYCTMHVTMGIFDEVRKSKIRAIIKAYGTPLQKIRYSFVIYTDLLWKNKWYNLPDESIVVCQSLIKAGEAEGDLLTKLVAQNILALAHLFRNEIVKAREVAFEVLDSLTDTQLGEETIRAYCTISFSYRKENNLEKTREWIGKAYEVADFNKNLTFKYLMDSITGWIHLKEGNFQKAKKFALLSYNGMSRRRYPFLAFSLIPLIAIYT
ncbi:MAG: hypothetical protein KF862_26845 [Chitinophagaceae bacterium]|nr:hypothetical protein [Chitinophagaceae bacterium]